MAVNEMKTLFDPELVGDLINKVKGKSSLALLTGQTPIPFTGLKEMTSTLWQRTARRRKAASPLSR